MRGSYGLGTPGGGGGFNGGAGGGGGGGGGIMRSVGRAMRTRINGLQDPFPNNSNSNNSNFHAKRSTTPPKRKGSNSNNMGKYGLSVSSSESKSKSNNNNVIPVLSPFYVVGNNDEINDDGEIVDYDDEWECLEDYYDPVFGVVPTTFEVNHAMLSLQQFLHPVPRSKSGTEEILSDVDKDMSSPKSSGTDVLERASSTRSSLDWIEPSMQLYDQRLASSYGWEKVYDAFHLLQTEPSVQKMVASLSSDKAVWDAILNNETVREIRESYFNAAVASPLNTDKNFDPSKENSNVLIWLMDHLKGKLMEVVGNITQFVGGIFSSPNPDKTEETHDFSEKLKSSFMLTILILLIVVVTRGSKA